MKLNKYKIPVALILSIILSLLFSIFLYAYLGGFSRLIADDYCSSSELINYGYIGAIQNRFLTWDGRYAFALLIYFFELFGNKVAQFLPAISIILLLISCFLTFYQLSKRLLQSTNKLYALFLATSFVFLLQTTTPNIGEVFFWLTGITTYQFFFVFEMLLLALTLRMAFNTNQLSRNGMIFFCCLFFVFSFLCSGFSEVTTTIHVSLFVLIILASRAFNKQFWELKIKQLCFLVAIFAGALLGFLVMIAAPGNNIRELNYSHPGIADILVGSIQQTVKYVYLWFTNHANIIWPAIIMIIVVTAFFTSYSPHSNQQDNAIMNKKVLLLCLAGVVLTFVSFIPTTWVGYQFPAERILFVPSFILSAFVLLSSVAVGLYFSQDFSFLNHNPRRFWIILTAFCALFIVSVPISTARQAYQDLYQKQAAFAEAWDLANESISQQVRVGETHLVIPSYSYDLMNIERVTDDPQNWVNKCAASYYQAAEIISR